MAGGPVDCLAVGETSERASIIKAAMRRHFAPERLPASTWLGVESLALDGLLIEIDAVAIAER